MAFDNVAGGRESDGRLRNTAFGRHIGRRMIAWLLFPLLALFAGIGAANAQIPIGTAVEVQPAATAELGGQTVTLLTGNQLYEGQTITTDATGEVQILFVDDTRMVLGPNSALVIERYLLRSPDTVEDLTVNILGGAFRFISGNSPSEAYSITTPTGTIGVRGTGLDGFYDVINKILEVLLYNGSVFICGPGGFPCIFLDVACSIGVVDTGEPGVIRDEELRIEIANEHFPWADAERFLLEQFRLGDTRRCLEDQNPASAPAEESSASAPSGSEGSSESGGSECSDSGCGSEGSESIDPDYPCGNAPYSCGSECYSESCSYYSECWVDSYWVCSDTAWSRPKASPSIVRPPPAYALQLRA